MSKDLTQAVAQLRADRQRPADDHPDWPDFMTHQVQPFWQQQVASVYFDSNGVRLHAAFSNPPNSTQVVVVAPGRIEAALKYQEFVWEMAQRNIAVAIIDHRGQGLSARETENPHQGHINDFQDFVTDFQNFLSLVSERLPQHRQVLLAHSMGGAIAALYLASASGKAHQRQLAQPLQGAVLSAPMFSISSGKAPIWLARAVVAAGYKLNQWFAKQKPWYFLGMGDYLPDPFAKNVLTHSAARYQAFRAQYQAEPKVQLGGPTFAWLYHALRASEKAIAYADAIEIPVQVVQAGGDQVIRPDGQERFAARLQHPDSGLQRVPDSHHEIVMEQDRYRDQLLAVLWQSLRN